MANDIVPLVAFSESDYSLVDSDEDILGFAVYDKDGDHVGHVDELLLDNSGPALPDRPESRKVTLAVIHTSGELGDGRVMVPFEVLRDVDQERREVKVTYGREYFEHGDAEFRSANLVDRDALGRLYGLYNMSPEWYDERAGADPEGIKYG